MSAAEAIGRAQRTGIPLDRIQKLLLWLMFFMGWLVIIEPSPSDVLFIPVLLIFLFSGLVIHATAAPMILFLLLYNIGGFISFLEVSNQTKATMFVITSFYMATSAMFRTCAVRLPAMKFTLSVRSFHVPATPGT